MAKIETSSLAACVESSRKYKSAGDFIARHSHPFSGQNSFLVLHGNIDNILADDKLAKAINDMPPTRASSPRFSTAPGDDTDDADTKYIASVFSLSSVVYEIIWHMCLNPKVDKSVKISVGRTPNNDIYLKNDHVSKHHGDFVLVKTGAGEDALFSVFYKDNSSHNGTGLKLPDASEESKIRQDVNVLITSRSEIGIGPFTFTFYSAEDIYNRVLRILKK